MRNVLASLAVILLLISCNSNTIASDTQSLSGEWGEKEVLEFDIPQMDSLKSYNLFLNIRNTNEYRYNNIFVIVSMNFPHGKTVTDTLEYRMANPDGSWLGQGIGNVKENKLWYKQNVSFPEEGTYTLNIAQAVRNNGSVEGVTKLEGITDVGFSIEEAPQQ